mmetsp:Transcript_16584/g.35848  ORF Transcript_16584/g.35848 Transcript_16584/m.35848 type:complete len:84 (-) Transcript_16584:291-542(-)
MDMPSKFQAYLEEIREANDSLLESVKARLITGIRVFETNKSPLLPAFSDTFESCVMESRRTWNILLKRQPPSLSLHLVSSKSN